MIEVAPCRGQTIAVMGLGASGLAAAKALVAGGARVLAWDDSESKCAAATAAGVPIVDLRSADWRNIDLLVMSPGIPHRFPKPHPVAAAARAAGVEIACDVELLARAQPEARYVGITGTNGKSTTTALIGHLLVDRITWTRAGCATRRLRTVPAIWGFRRRRYSAMRGSGSCPGPRCTNWMRR